MKNRILNTLTLVILAVPVLSQQRVYHLAHTFQGESTITIANKKVIVSDGLTGEEQQVTEDFFGLEAYNGNITGGLGEDGLVIKSSELLEVNSVGNEELVFTDLVFTGATTRFGSNYFIVDAGPVYNGTKGATPTLYYTAHDDILDITNDGNNLWVLHFTATDYAIKKVGADTTDIPVPGLSTKLTHIADTVFAYRYLDGVSSIVFYNTSSGQWEFVENTNDIVLLHIVGGTINGERVIAGVWQEGIMIIFIDRPANSAPVITSDLLVTAVEDQLLEYTITATDANDDAISFSARSIPSWLSFDGTDKVSGTPTNAELGDFTFDITADDDQGGVTTEIVTVIVNNTPIIDSDLDIKTNEDELFEYTITGTDPNNDDLTASASNVPTWLTFNSETQTFNGTPTNADVGVYNIEISLTDGITTDTETLVVTVVNVDDAPVWTNTIDDIIVKAAAENQIFDLISISADIDNDVAGFSYTVTSSNTNVVRAAIDSSNGLDISFNGVGTATLMVTLISNGLSVIMEIAVKVEDNITELNVLDWTDGDPLKANHTFTIPTSFSGIPADYALLTPVDTLLGFHSIEISGDNREYVTKDVDVLKKDELIFEGPKGDKVVLQMMVAPWNISFEQNSTEYTSITGDEVIKEVDTNKSNDCKSKYVLKLFAQNGDTPDTELFSQNVTQENTLLSFSKDMFGEVGILNGELTGSEIVVFRAPHNPEAAAIFGVSARGDWNLVYINNLNSDTPEFELSDGVISITIPHTLNVNIATKVTCDNGNVEITLDNSNPDQTSGSINIANAVEGPGKITLERKGFIGPVFQENFIESEIFFWADNFGKVTHVSNEPITAVTGLEDILQTDSFKNYPNPFDSQTNISYTLRKTSFVQVMVYNSFGKEVVNLVSEKQFPGEYQIIWNTNDINTKSGIYFLRFSDGKSSVSKKLVFK